jgi:cell division inhibitor SepF
MNILKKMLGYPADTQTHHDYNKKKQVNLQRDLIEFVKVTSASQALPLADQVIDGTPLVVNFDDLAVSEANQMIAFLSGVVYSINGTNLQMQSKVFLFTADDNLKDGSVMEFYQEYKEE